MSKDSIFKFQEILSDRLRFFSSEKVYNFGTLELLGTIKSSRIVFAVERTIPFPFEAIRQQIAKIGRIEEKERKIQTAYKEVGINLRKGYFFFFPLSLPPPPKLHASRTGGRCAPAREQLYDCPSRFHVHSLFPESPRKARRKIYGGIRIAKGNKKKRKKEKKKKAEERERERETGGVDRRRDKEIEVGKGCREEERKVARDCC